MQEQTIYKDIKYVYVLYWIELIQREKAELSKILKLYSFQNFGSHVSTAYLCSEPENHGLEISLYVSINQLNQ